MTSFLYGDYIQAVKERIAIVGPISIPKCVQRQTCVIDTAAMRERLSGLGRVDLPDFMQSRNPNGVMGG